MDSTVKPLEKPPEHTTYVSRDMISYLLDPQIVEAIKEFNFRYLYWSEFRYKKIPDNVTHLQLWKLLKLKRELNAEEVKISELEGFSFSYNMTPYIQEMLHLFDLNLGGTLQGNGIIPAEDKDQFLITSIMEEAIASSQLEGASTTRREAIKMLLQEREPRDKSEQMILNNYNTIKTLSGLKNEKLTMDIILDIHRKITEDTLDDPAYAGRLRTSDDTFVIDKATGNIIHTPPGNIYLNSLMQDLCDFANREREGEFIHPVIKATILHFLIGYIHPFVDGNGRTARAVFYWYLLSKGYWLIEYMSISRMIKDSPVQYSRAYQYTEQDENDLTYFINYQLRTMDSAFKDLKGYIAARIQEKRQLYDFARIEGLNERQAYILKWLSEDQNMIFTIKEMENRFSIVYQTARTDILGLEEMGFIRRNILNRKKLVFYRSEDFNKVIRKRKV